MNVFRYAKFSPGFQNRISRNRFRYALARQQHKTCCLTVKMKGKTTENLHGSFSNDCLAMNGFVLITANYKINIHLNETPNIYNFFLYSKLGRQFVLAPRRYIPLSIATSTTSKYKNKAITSNVQTEQIGFFFSWSCKIQANSLYAFTTRLVSWNYGKKKSML